MLRYRKALNLGFRLVRETGLLTTSTILQVQAELERNQAGYRRVPGTSLKNQRGEVVYTPPQQTQQIGPLMGELEQFINAAEPFPADPLVRMALVHHQFESIHPFYDGNGRTGRIINVLYLVQQGLLDTPVLYLSREILRTRTDYYQLLQQVRTEDAWENWVAYLLDCLHTSAREAISEITAIRELLMATKHELRNRFKFYSQDLLNNLFTHPYTRIDHVMRELRVSRATATKYLKELTRAGFLDEQRIGRSNYYLNQPLIEILTR